LIEFSFAIEARDLEKDAAILDGSEMTNEIDANWKALAKISMETQNISVAEHCYAALGNISKAGYLRKIMRIIEKYQSETGRNDGISFYKVQAKLAILEKQFHRTESILLENN
jgi:intraflagellar transport protein 172